MEVSDAARIKGVNLHICCDQCFKFIDMMPKDKRKRYHCSECPMGGFDVCFKCADKLENYVDE